MDDARREGWVTTVLPAFVVALVAAAGLGVTRWGVRRSPGQIRRRAEEKRIEP